MSAHAWALVVVMVVILRRPIARSLRYCAVLSLDCWRAFVGTFG